jgi:hypothetical protein
MTRIRHAKVGGGVYYSTDSKGRKRFEVRHPVTRVYEVVGTRLDEAKARAAELTTKHYKGEVVASPSTTVADLIAGWKGVRNVKPRTAETQDAGLAATCPGRRSRRSRQSVEPEGARRSAEVVGGLAG